MVYVYDIECNAVGTRSVLQPQQCMNQIGYNAPPPPQPPILLPHPPPLPPLLPPYSFDDVIVSLINI